MRRLPAEFEEQSFIQLIFPHKKSDWSCCLNDAEKNFINIIKNIANFQQAVVVCDNIKYVKSKFDSDKNIKFIQYQTDDTWARDICAITVYEDEKPILLDFTFNAWGGKFSSDLDNSMNKNISSHYNVEMLNIDFTLEGGAIESNSKGIALMTEESVFNKNRNSLSREKSIAFLKKIFGLKKILILKNGSLKGDDTDSHIDTLARFVDKKTIVYLQCQDKNDEHFLTLKAMENELKNFTDEEENPFTLIPLPFTKPIYENGSRLPATYANFLILNKAILLPVYDDENDKKALKILQNLFPKKEIVPINCSTLIRQHGSLHCVSMQFPKGVEIITKN